MKKLFTIFVILFLGHSALLADWGPFATGTAGIEIDFKGTKAWYRIADGLPAFDGFNLGDYNNYSDVLGISGWYIHTFKNGTGSTGNVTGAALMFRIYEVGSSAPSYSTLAANFISNDEVPGDQTWGNSSNYLSEASRASLVAGKTYKFEVYLEIYGQDNGGSIYTKYFSNFGNNFVATFTTNSALPVELTSFNAAIRNGLVDLKWETATEVNNYGFEVERKTASADWSKIGFVEGHGSTNSPKYYSYSDKPVGTGKIAYRLKQIDNDGQFEYSPEVEVLVDNLPNGFVLEQNYPNPFNPETSIRFALKEDTKATLKVYNSLGAEIATLFDGTAEAGRYYDVKFGGSELASGFYIYKLVAGEYVSVKKMLLMK